MIKENRPRKNGRHYYATFCLNMLFSVVLIIGKDYLISGSSYERELANRVLAESETTFSMDSPGAPWATRSW